jgi:hypothetical protein
MLRSLKLNHAGPAPHMEIEFAERLNLLTGDNGLGKSFLLDTAWWALTRKWPRDINPKLTSSFPVRPSSTQEASIAFKLTTTNSKDIEYVSTYSSDDQAWVGRPGRPWNPGLVIYAHADGGFSVWDPARNYWKQRDGIDVQDRLPGYVFSPNEVWEGLDVVVDGSKKRVCNGLLTEWASWIRERGESANLMVKILAKLAPSREPFDVGPLVPLTLDDANEVPSIVMPGRDGPPVPVLHASAGVRRILGLAYMLLWSWQAHERASKLLEQPPVNTVILLFDELEAHLHPRWQRTILRSLLEIVNDLHGVANIQIIAATHSPLVLASAETLFDPEKDAWHDFDLVNRQVELRKRCFVPHGDVSNWLTSNAFDLPHSRSEEAEQALDLALAVLRERNPSRESVEAADHALVAARLPDLDPFWIRWRHFVQSAAGIVEPDDANHSANSAHEA